MPPPPLIAHSTHDEAPTAISVHPHETAMTCNVCFAEKNLLLDFTNGRTGTFEMTDCTFGGGRRRHLSQEKGYWTWGVEGVSQWTAFRPTCTFSGVECYEDGHVRSMCAPQPSVLLRLNLTCGFAVQCARIHSIAALL